MIVRQADDGVLLITQPAHAHLAGRFMEHCVPLAGRPRRSAILHAISTHDNGWAEEDAFPSVDPSTGTVVDFVHASREVRHAVWRRGVGRLAPEPWAAALVAQHALTVYDRNRSDAEWAPFFTEVEGARDAMLRSSGMPLEDLTADYAFVRLADLISLTFCAGWTDEQRFGAWEVRLSGARVLVRPDAFGGREIPIEIAGRKIGSRRLSSSEELREALIAARTMVLRGEIAAG